MPVELYALTGNFFSRAVQITFKKFQKKERTYTTEWKLSNRTVAKIFTAISTNSQSNEIVAVKKQKIARDSSFNVQGLYLSTIEIWVVLMKMIN